MKKLIAIIASIALACMLAFTVTSCQSNEDKAVALQEKMLKAAKNDDVEAFKKATKEMMELAKSLSKEEQEAIGKKLENKFSEADEDMIEEFATKHAAELMDVLGAAL